jgi:hypothetical protein
MNRFITACELFDIKLLEIKYSDYDDDGYITEQPAGQAATLISSRFNMSGMTCGACVGTIEKAVQQLSGVQE